MNEQVKHIKNINKSKNPFTPERPSYALFPKSLFLSLFLLYFGGYLCSNISRCSLGTVRFVTYQTHLNFSHFRIIAYADYNTHSNIDTFTRACKHIILQA